jgi:hypothetical protein
MLRKVLGRWEELLHDECVGRRRLGGCRVPFALFRLRCIYEEVV